MYEMKYIAPIFVAESKKRTIKGHKKIIVTIPNPTEETKK